MWRWIQESLMFLLVLGALQLARLAVVLFCIIEVLGVLVLWAFAFVKLMTQNSAAYFWIPVGASLLVAIQVSLWQFTWLRIAQRGGRWRAIAECFSEVVRYPVVRTPHDAWE